MLAVIYPAPKVGSAVRVDKFLCLSQHNRQHALDIRPLSSRTFSEQRFHVLDSSPSHLEDFISRLRMLRKRVGAVSTVPRFLCRGDNRASLACLLLVD